MNKFRLTCMALIVCGLFTTSPTHAEGGDGGGDGGGFDGGESTSVRLGSEDRGGSLKSLVLVITDHW